MFYNQKWFVIGIDEKNKEATIYNIANASLSVSLGQNMNISADVDKIKKVDLERLASKFFISNIEDVSDEELIALLNENGCLRSEKVG